MKKSLIKKAETAKKRLHPRGQAQADRARTVHELRAAANSRALSRAIKPDLELEDIRALAAAARKQLHRG